MIAGPMAMRLCRRGKSVHGARQTCSGLSVYRCWDAHHLQTRQQQKRIGGIVIELLRRVDTGRCIMIPPVIVCKVVRVP